MGCSIDEIIQILVHPVQFLVLLHQFFIFDALRKISGDLGKADVLVLLIKNRSDQHIGPKLGSVLPHTPSLILKPSFLESLTKLILRIIAINGFRYVKYRNRLPQHLMSFIPFNFFSTVIPGRYVALRRDQEDSVILYS